jgi:hypothetical protein
VDLIANRHGRTDIEISSDSFRSIRVAGGLLAEDGKGVTNAIA